MLILTASANAFLAFLTLLPLSTSEKWWVRSMDYPRLQIVTVTLVLLAAELFILDVMQPTSIALIVTTLSILIYHLWWIAPYSRLFPVEVQPGSSGDTENSIRILIANVLTTNRNAKAFLSLVDSNEPDIVLTLESDQWWEEQLKDVEASLPHCVKVPLDNLYGMHLFSRYPLLDTQVKYLVEDDVPSIHTLIELPSGKRVRGHFVHPAPPSPTENDSSIERDAELILVAKSVENSPMACIVAGDLNDVAWSSTTRLFRRISGLRDPRIGRSLLNTFHAKFWFVRWPLDHIFLSESFKLASIKRLPTFGSDHFAIFAELVYDRQGSDEDIGLEKREQDKTRAEAKLAATETSLGEVPSPGET